MLKDVALGTEVTLTDSEIKIVTWIGNARNFYQQQKNVQNLKRSDQSDAEIHILGAAGELAFCKLHNVFLDMMVRKPQDDWIRDHDVIFRDKKVDVKTTPKTTGDLLVPPFKRDKDVDAFSLMVGTLPTFIFKGFSTLKEIFQEQNLCNLGKGPTYKIPQSALKLFSMLDFG